MCIQTGAAGVYTDATDVKKKSRQEQLNHLSHLMEMFSMARPKGENKCSWPRCKANSDIVWLARGLCEKHWGIISRMKSEDAKIKLGIKRRKE